MGFPQKFWRQSGRKLSRIPYLNAVGKHNNLDKAVIPVVLVGNRIDNGLGDNRPGNLESYRRLHVFCPCPNTAVNFAENEFDGLVDDFKQPAGIGLLRCNGFSFFRSMKMKSVYLSIIEKSLWLLAKKKHGGICGLVIPQ